MIKFTITTEAGDKFKVTDENCTTEEFIATCLIITEMEFARVTSLYYLPPAQKVLVSSKVHRAFDQIQSTFRFKSSVDEKFVEGWFEEVQEEPENEPFIITNGEIDAWDYLKTLLETAFESNDEGNLFDETLKAHTNTINEMFKRFEGGY